MQSQCWTRGRPSSWRRLPSAECVSCSTSARRVLNGKAHNDVSLPVTFTFRELLGAAEVMLRKGTVEYTVSGDVTVDSPFGRVTRPYKTTARIDNATLIPR